MIFDTASPLARAHYDRQVATARAYVARCQPVSDRLRVLVSGFGRFRTITDNASARIVSMLTGAPVPGPLDIPETGLRTVTLPDAGAVDIAGVVLPVAWDLAAIVLARELDAFRPSLVVMNGVAGARDALWIELGAGNHAKQEADGTGVLRPATSALLPGANERARPNLFAWRAAMAAANAAIERHTAVLGDVLPAARLAGFPRPSNAYVCNALTFVTSYLMDHPGEAVPLLETPGSAIVTGIAADLRAVPRAFLHWPSELGPSQIGAATDVLSAVLDAQLSTTEPPSRGDERLADPSLAGGEWY